LVVDFVIVVVGGTHKVLVTESSKVDVSGIVVMTVRVDAAGVSVTIVCNVVVDVIVVTSVTVEVSKE